MHCMYVCIELDSLMEIFILRICMYVLYVCMYVVYICMYV